MEILRRREASLRLIARDREDDYMWMLNSEGETEAIGLEASQPANTDRPDNTPTINADSKT